MEWVRESLHSRKDFADFLIPQLFAVSKCPCGTCRTVGLEPLELPNCKGRSGKVGGLSIQTKEHGSIDILLHANDGFLVEMEVIWYNFPQPFHRFRRHGRKSAECPTLRLIEMGCSSTNMDGFVVNQA